MGVLAARMRWIAATSAKDLSNLVFLVLGPALLFRTMSSVRLEQMQPSLLAAYYLGSLCIFAGALAIGGFNRRSAVIGLAANFGNNLMVGVPLIGLAYGEPGLAHLFTLAATQSAVLLTIATVVLELAVVREQRAAGGVAHRPVGRTVLRAVRSAIIHPVPIPIICGLVVGQLGWTIPPVIDKPLQLLGQAFAPLALVMVGVSLAQSRIGRQWLPALRIALAKNVLQPLLVLAFGWAFGLDRLVLSVLVVTACLPTGANAMLFAQRYEVAQEDVAATMAISALLSLAALTVALAAFGS